MAKKMISRRNFMKCTAAMAAAAGLAACGGSGNSTSTAASSTAGTSSTAASGETVKYRCSTNHAENFNVSQALRYWSDLVLERTNGRIEIDIYYDAVLGDEKSAIEQCQYGGLEFARINISPMCEFVDDLNALSMPYIYKNDEHFWKVAETLGMDILRSDKMKEAGFYGLTWRHPQFLQLQARDPHPGRYEGHEHSRAGVEPDDQHDRGAGRSCDRNAVWRCLFRPADRRH